MVNWVNHKEMNQMGSSSSTGLSLDAVERRIIKEFLDVIVLLELKDKGEL